MRVIAGKFRSRTLQSLPGNDTRPTYDRLKETLFNVLQSAIMFEGVRFLDLFAGTGSIGIEALSRGAAHATFVESGRKAANLIRANVKSIGIGPDEADVLEMTAAEAIAVLSRGEQRYDVIFLDPPYAMQGEYDRVLRLLSKTDVSTPPPMTPHTIVVAEHDKRFDPGEGYSPLTRYRTLTQGESSLSFYTFPSL